MLRPLAVLARRRGKPLKALLIRDLRLALRAGGGFGLGLAFFLLVAVLVPLGVGPEGSTLGRIAPGILWVGALLACLLSLDRIFALDYEDGSLDLLATSPIPLEGVVAVKALAHWLVTGLPLTLVAPVLGLLMNLPAAGYGWLVLSLALGTPALSVIGAFGAALVVGVKRGGLLLSLLVLPLYVPTLIYGAEAVKRGATGLEAGGALALMAAVTAGAVAVLPFAAAAALRVNLR
jgi:heme exporter protein B